MKSKWLDDINVTSVQNELSDCRNKEVLDSYRNEYGVELYDSWGLDVVSAEWLYCQIKSYYDQAKDVINLEYYKFEVDIIQENDIVNKELTQEECIHEIIEYLEYFLKEDHYITGEELPRIKLSLAFGIYSKIINAMWW